MVLTEDHNISHSFLNQINSGFQGSYVFRNAMNALGFECELGPLDTLPPILDRIAQLSEFMWQGNGYDFLNKPFSDGAAEILKLAKQLYNDLSKNYELVHSALEEIKDTREINQFANAIVAASLCRQAYAREHFITWLVKYGEVFELDEVADRWRQQLLHTKNEIQAAEAILLQVKEQNYTHLQPKRLWNESANIHIIFQTQMVDMVNTIHRCTNQTTFDSYRIPKEQVADWQEFGFIPQDAFLWFANGFTAAEAMQWLKRGFLNGGMAGAWKAREFSLSEASAWLDAQFNAIEAKYAIMDGHSSPHEARQQAQLKKQNSH